MRRAFHLLVALAVLMCGLHVGEADTAHPATAHSQLAQDASAPGDTGDASPQRPAKLADAGHHHCPVAPDQGVAVILCREGPATILTLRPVVALRSLLQAPPIEPPTA